MEKLISADIEASDIINSFMEDLKLDELKEHENVSAFFEHDQWFITCSACGASWSVVDLNDDDLDIEEIYCGDESCLDN